MKEEEWTIKLNEEVFIIRNSRNHGRIEMIDNMDKVSVGPEKVDIYYLINFIRFN